MSADPTFRIEGIRVGYDGGADALSELDLEIGAGEQIAVVGPSGAGKTTLLRLLNGTLHPASGTVEVEGEALAKLAPRALRALRSRIGFVHQDHSLVPNLRVVQNVVAGRLGRRGLLQATRSLIWPSRSDLLAAHALLERVGIADLLYRRTDTLSGGQQQRVAIARALFQDPVAILADEPVASVDPARARSIIALLAEVARERGLTLVTSLHDLELARGTFDRIVGLRRGRIVFDSSKRAVGDDDFEALYRLEPGASGDD